MSRDQREMLLLHMDGPVPFVRSKEPKLNYRRIALSLVARGWLRFQPTFEALRSATRPPATVMTDDGRRALCRLLGEYADVLDRAVALRLEVETERAVAIMSQNELV